MCASSPRRSAVGTEGGTCTGSCGRNTPHVFFPPADHPLLKPRTTVRRVCGTKTESTVNPLNIPMSLPRLRTSPYRVPGSFHVLKTEKRRVTGREEEKKEREEEKEERENQREESQRSTTRSTKERGGGYSRHRPFVKGSSHAWIVGLRRT